MPIRRHEFLAEFRTEVPPLSQASRAVPEMRFTGEDIVLSGERPYTFVFTAHGTRFDAFEAALDRDPTVASYRALAKFSETAYYVVTYTVETGTRGTYHVAVEEDISYIGVELRDGEYAVRARVPDREALATLREHCREHDIPFRLDRLYEETEEGKGVLTDAQREALKRAYERGYFDSPRRATLSDVGDDLGISRQAVAGRLRRGHRRLLEATVV